MKNKHVTGLWWIAVALFVGLNIYAQVAPGVGAGGAQAGGVSGGSGGGNLTGSGTTGSLAKWASSSSLTDAVAGTDYAGIDSVNPFTGSQETVYATMGATAVDFAKAGNSYSATANATLTYSNNTANAATFLRITADSSDHTITIPTTWSLTRGGNITTVLVPASTTLQVKLQHLSSRDEILGDPPATTGSGSYVLATAGVISLTNGNALPDGGLTLTDVSTNNVSTSKHGFAPKSPNDATKYLDGTGAYSVPSGGNASDIQTFTSNGTWTKPSGTPKSVTVICWGGGGGGAGGYGAAISAMTKGGGGSGGGGARISNVFQASDLPSTVSVTVGVGGTSGSGGSSGNGSNGGDGGGSSFGGFVFSGGGGGGAGGQTTGTASGGAGGGSASSAVLSTQGSPAGGGLTGGNVFGNVGGAPSSSGATGNSEYGGAGGGYAASGAATAVAGGSAIYGGGSGGGGAGSSAGAVVQASGAGGKSGSYTNGGGGSAGSGSSAGTAGSSAVVAASPSGYGGGGGGVNDSGTGGGGGVGGFPAGGGGGGGAGVTTGGSGALGGAGQCVVITTY